MAKRKTAPLRLDYYPGIVPRWKLKEEEFNPRNPVGYQCPYCGAQFSNSYDFGYHLILDHMIPLSKVKEITKKAKFKHNPRSGGETMRCPVCKTRIYVGRGVRRLTCPTCGAKLAVP